MPAFIGEILVMAGSFAFIFAILICCINADKSDTYSRQLRTIKSRNNKCVCNKCMQQVYATSVKKTEEVYTWTGLDWTPLVTRASDSTPPRSRPPAPAYSEQILTIADARILQLFYFETEFAVARQHF